MTNVPLTGTSLLSCLNHLRSASSMLLSSAFEIALFLIHSDNFGTVFPNRLDRRIHVTKFPHTSKAMAMLWPCHSPVNCRNRRVECNFTNNVSYRYYCNFPCLELWLPERFERRAFSRTRWLNSENSLILGKLHLN